MGGVRVLETRHRARSVRGTRQRALPRTIPLRRSLPGIAAHLVRSHMHRKIGGRDDGTGRCAGADRTVVARTDMRRLHQRAARPVGAPACQSQDSRTGWRTRFRARQGRLRTLRRNQTRNSAAGKIALEGGISGHRHPHRNIAGRRLPATIPTAKAEARNQSRQRLTTSGGNDGRKNVHAGFDRLTRRPFAGAVHSHCDR